MRDTTSTKSMPKSVTKINDPKWRANCKYRRLKTLIKNCVEVGKQCNLNLNLLVFSSWGQRLQENYTDQSVALNKLVDNILDSRKITNQSQNSTAKTTKPSKFKIESRDASTQFRNIGESQSVLDDEPKLTPKLMTKSKKICKTKTLHIQPKKFVASKQCPTKKPVL